MTDLTAEQLEEVENPVGRVREDFTAPNTDTDDTYRRTRPSFTIGDPYDYAKRLELVTNPDGTYALAIGAAAGNILPVASSASSPEVELLQHIHVQLHLLNARFEEAFRTGITEGDIDSGDD
jgi:hypothetical protein